MDTVIFVGLRNVPTIDLVSSERLKVVCVPDPQGAFCVIEGSPARLVVADASFDDGEPGSLLKKILLLQPEFRATVITVVSTAPTRSLNIHEWDAAQGRFRTRFAPLEAFHQEVDAVCARSEKSDFRPTKADLEIQSLEAIGYYKFLEQGQRAFHVQTEVIAGKPVMIRTTVVENGAILEAHQTSSLEESSSDAITELAASQQEKAVSDVQNGKYQ